MAAMQKCYWTLVLFKMWI